MGVYEDGVYSSEAGKTLLAKVLAGRCELRYTRVAAGSGSLTSSQDPRTMTQPAGYQMDAVIAGVSNPVDGECQVTVQIDSDNVASAFYLTGLMVYAKDPDAGEVPYAYLVLEADPEYIRQADSGIQKIASFDIVTAVGDVEKVVADIDPESLMTHEEAERLIQESYAEIDDEIQYMSSRISDMGGMSMSREIVIPTTGWETESKAGGLYVDVPFAEASEDSVPSVTIARGSEASAYTAKLSATAQALTGRIRFFAQSVPESEITAYAVVMSGQKLYGTDLG